MRSQPPQKYKIIVYLAAWVLALFATDPGLRWWAIAHLFPLGLFGFFFPSLRQDGSWGVLAGCVSVYLVHAVFFFRAPTWRAFYILLLVMVGLLICNISGCREMLQIH